MIRRAFTLVELAAAIAIAGVITAVAANVYVVILSLVSSNQVRARLVDEASASLNYVLNEAALASGGQVPVRASVIVEPDCGARGPFPDCGGSDRVTVVQPLVDYRVCAIVAQLSADTIEVARQPGPTAACCLADTPTADNGAFKRQMMLSAAGPPAIDVPAFVSLDAANSCRFRFQPLIPLADLPVPPAAVNLAGGAAQLADIKTFYLEPLDLAVPVGVGPARLVMHTELDGDLSSAQGERLDLTPATFDLQVTLGFSRAGTGLVAEESAAAPGTDDWAFNDPGGDAGFDYDALSMVAASMTVALRDRSAVATWRVAPWGPVRRVPAGLRAATSSGRIGLRALAGATTTAPPPTSLAGAP